MATSKPREGFTKAIHPSLGVASLAVFLGIVLLSACGGGDTVPPPTQEPARPAPATQTPAAATLHPASQFPTATLPPATQPPTATPLQDQRPAGHAAEEGLELRSETGESVYQGAKCAADAPVRGFDVAAINVEISLNRFLDYDPQGRMYVLEQDLARAKQEEAQNRAARSDQAEPAVTIGLQGDAIQPLTLRINQGDCLRITLRNVLETANPPACTSTRR